MPTWFDVTLKVVTPVTALIALFVAIIGYNQWRISRDKLRLDLFNRRFDIYLRVLDYYQQLLQWQDKPEQIALGMPFIKAVRESRFIFPKDSGVHQFLEDFQKHVYPITGYTEVRKSLQGMPKELSEFAQKKLDNVNWILNSMKTLEDKMEPYLRFESL